MECPGMETLAAFVDGTLPAAERQRAVVHLATCEACYEVVTETLHTEDELEEELETAPSPKKVVPFPGRAGRYWVPGLIAAAAAAVLVIVIGPALLPVDLPSLARGVQRPSGDNIWTPGPDPTRGWDQTRSFETPENHQIVAENLQVGGQLADLRLAIEWQDREAVQARARELGSTLNRVSLDFLVGQAKQIEEMAKDSASFEDLALEAGDLEERIEGVADQGGLRLGYWAQIGRMAVLQGDLEALDSGPWRRQLRKLRHQDLPDGLKIYLEEAATGLEAEDPEILDRTLTRILQWQPTASD